MEPSDALIPAADRPKRHCRTIAIVLTGFTVGLASVLLILLVLFVGETDCDGGTEYNLTDGWSTSGEFAPLYDWEGDTVVEPALVTVGNTTHMFYRAGWGRRVQATIGHAKLLNSAWQRAPFPLFDGAQPWVRHTDKFEIFYTHPTEAVAVATSTDAVYWNHTILNLPQPDGWRGWGNRAILSAPDSKRGCEVLYQEVKIEKDGGEVWEIFIYEHRAVYTLAGRLTLPRPLNCGMYGGITFEHHDTFTKVWYHAALASGNLPTAIFSVTTTDMETWHNFTCEVATPFNHDQAADPIMHNGILYYDVDDNSAERARIRWAVREDF